MPHWRLLVPTKYLCAADLRDADRNVVIERVELGEMTEVDEKTKKRRNIKKGLVYFKGKDKALVLNVTNAQTIADLYGPQTDEWAGMPITLYPTTCLAFGKRVECVRIRDRAPEPRRKAKEEPPPPSEVAQLRAEIEAGDTSEAIRARVFALPLGKEQDELLLLIEEVVVEGAGAGEGAA